MLSTIGIYGWETIEPVILAAMASKHAVLLVGTHGAAKTDGAFALIKAVAGPQANVQKYDVPNLQAEELLGYPNPADLIAGQPMSYIPTPISIWGKQGILLDELNRAHFMTQSKVVELIRERSIMGMPTEVEYVFAAVNPPASYGALYMELALASRFVTVEVPDLTHFPETTLVEILNSEIKSDTGSLQGIMETVREATISPEDKHSLQRFVAQIAKLLQKELTTTDTDPGYCVRSMRMLYDLLESSEKLQALSPEYAAMMEADTILDLVMSTVPEVWGVTQRIVDKNNLSAKVKVLINDFKLGSAVTSSSDIEDFLALDLTTEDTLAWGVSVCDKVNEISNSMKLTKVVKQVISKMEEVPEEVANAILISLLKRASSLDMLDLEKYRMTDEGILEMIKDVFNLGDK